MEIALHMHAKCSWNAVETLYSDTMIADRGGAQQSLMQLEGQLGVRTRNLITLL